jgi:hypothetical protein
MSILHIHNGDSSAEGARQSSLHGEHFAWREALIDGPTPAGVEGEEWRRLRGQHLAEFYEVDPEETVKELLIQEEKLASYADHDEVVLWFEHDLFCQANLIYLINWFSERDLGRTKLSLICVGEFPGRPNFRGLGELNPVELASLFDGRHEVSKTEKTLAVSAWRAYCSPEPTSIQTLLTTDTAALPFLKPALQLHLQRFPSVGNGLGRIENRSLEFIHDEVRSFVELFSRFRDVEPTYGLGDSQFWSTLRRMGDAHRPLVDITSIQRSDSKPTAENFHQTRFEITETGDAVLNRQADFVQLNGVDTWLGGVHLVGKGEIWRWNDEVRTLTCV